MRPSGRGTPSGFPHLRRLPLPIIEAPPGGRSTNPPGRNSTAFAKIKQPSSSTAQKRQSARRGQADRLRLDPGDVANSKAARLNAKKRAAPQESNARPPACSSIAGNDEAGHGRHRPPAPPERAQDARSRPRPGAGRSIPEKRLYGPPMRPESTDQVRGRPPWPRRRVVFSL